LETTVAVNVTACPKLDGFCELVNDVPVGAFLTTCFNIGEALPANNASPLYTTVILRVPAARVAIVSCAPPPLRGTVARVVAPFMKVTVPVGLPDDDVTVAVNVTDCTKVEGLRLETAEVDVLP
jgi:hypothetical protein